MSAAVRAAAVAVAVIAVDQGTKTLVRDGMQRGDSDPVLPGLKLVHVHNEGVAFGFLSDGGALVPIVTGVAMLALLVFFVLHRGRPLIWLPVGLLLGGALGNVIDRVAQGHVTDFLKIPKWPAFNVADIAITFGVLALLYVLEGPPRHAEADRRPA